MYDRRFDPPFPSTRRPPVPVLLALLSLALPATGVAQTVAGHVLEEGTRVPVEGAFVRLVGDAEKEVAATFTDASGEFRLVAPAPGRFRLTVERIGYPVLTGDRFRLEAGAAVERDLFLTPEAIGLAGVSTTSESRCEDRPESGEATYRLWRETRKALEAAEWTADRGLLEIRTRTFQRRLDEDLRVEETLAEQYETGFGVSPFTSLPAGTLSEQGYVESVGQHLIYYGPDADALLSDEFQRDHCFWITRDDAPDAGWVGLAFRPVDGRDVPEIRGVLWLEEATAELKRLDFRYVNLGLATSYHDGGGRVDFLRLPSGPWIVRRWSLRMPRIERERLRIEGYVRDEYEVAFYDEEGGEVHRIATAEGRQLYDFERATLTGAVWDSLEARPLASARVELVGTELSDSTDVRGRFRLPGVEEGSYTVRVDSDRLRSWGLEPLTREVSISQGELVRVSLATPGPVTVARRACPDLEEGRSALVGRVVRASDGRPVAGARLAAVWAPEDRPGGRAAAAEPAEAPVRPADEGTDEPASRLVHREVRTDSAGRYAMCGVPAGTDVALRAAADGDATELVRLTTPRRGAHSRDLALTAAGRTERMARLIGEQGLANPSAAGPTAAGTTGAIVGRVTASGDGRPLPSVEIRLESGRTAVTDSAGRFRLDDLEPGTHRVHVVHLGASSRQSLVRVPPGDTVRPTLALVTDPVPLPELAVQVEGRRERGKLAGFYQRMEDGTGHYRTREDIEEIPGNDLAAVFRDIPGVRVVPCDTRGAAPGCRTLEGGRAPPRSLTPGERLSDRPPLRTGDRDPRGLGPRCGVAYFIDGAPVNLAQIAGRGEEDSDNLSLVLKQISKSQVQAIEVYAGTAQTPSRFKSVAMGCTRLTVVIWTRTGA